MTFKQYAKSSNQKLNKLAKFGLNHIIRLYAIKTYILRMRKDNPDIQDTQIILVHAIPIDILKQD